MQGDSEFYPRETRTSTISHAAMHTCQGVGFITSVLGLGCRVQGMKLELRLQHLGSGLGIRVQGPGFGGKALPFPAQEPLLPRCKLPGE